MKKYVYSKGFETVTVETDGLGSINNFMVTGVIGKNYHGLVQAGLQFKMGDEVTIPMMLNAAKVCKCKVEAYEGDRKIEDESVDFTEEPAKIVSEYSISCSYPEEMTHGTDYQVTSTLKASKIGEVGYDKVLIKFKTTCPEGGHCLIKMKDSLDQEFSFSDNGSWGPEEGFPLPANYDVTSEMTVNYSQSGNYTHTTEVVNLENDSVIASAITTVTIL